MVPAPLPAASFVPEGLLHDLLEVSLTAINVLRPVYGPTGEIVDFTLDYLNPAAQRMSVLPERPGGTLLSHRPHTAATGILDYYRRVFETSATEVHEVNYQAEGLDNFFRLAARRSGEWLIVSFTDTADQPRTPVEIALREAQAAEKAARADAEAQRNDLRDFVEHAPVAVAVYRGPEYRVELANATTLAIWGRALPDVLGRPVFEVLPEAGTPEVRAIFEQVFATGVPHTAIEQPTFIHRYGRQETVYWNFVFQPERQPDGRISGIRSVGTEVTEQVRARQQVEQLNQELETRVQERASEALDLQAQLLAASQRQAAARESLYQVFEQTPALVALLRDPGHRFEYVNPAYQVFFPGRPLVGRDVAEAAPELVAQGFGALLDGVFQSGETYFGQDLPFTLPPAPGQAPRTAYFNFTYQAYREDGVVAGVSIFAFEVTEQVLARQQREAERRLLTDVFAQAPAGIWVVRGPDYVFEVVNPAMTQILGRSTEQALGRPYFEVLPELTSQGLPELLRRVWEQGESVLVEELAAHLAYHAPGEMGHFTFVFQPLRDKYGQVARISCVALDVTSQVRARQQVQELNEELAAINEELQATNEELQDSNRQLTRTNVDLDTFVYTASHDLKAPITNIESIVLALRDTLPPEVQQDGIVAHLLDLLNQTVARFQLTIGQLTDISRLQLAHVGPAEPVTLATVVSDVRLDLMSAIAAAGTQLTVAVDAGLVVSFSPANLRSIVYNLLSNATKYRDPDRPSQVQVRAAQTPQAVVLTVQDNGLGMSEVQQRQLFGLFQRLHTHVEGTGVGLYITKRLIENAGGTITVQSQPHVGTTFTVTFPA